MGTVVKEIRPRTTVDAAWDAIRDIGALHTRLVPGFVIDTRLEPGARVVTFGNGAVVREPIVTLDGASRRLVWTAQGVHTTHYNASVQVFDDGEGKARIVWIADFLPDAVAPAIDAAMSAGMVTMKATLER